MKKATPKRKTVSRKDRKERKREFASEWIYRLRFDGQLVCSDPVTGAWYRVPGNEIIAISGYTHVFVSVGEFRWGEVKINLKDFQENAALDLSVSDTTESR